MFLDSEKRWVGYDLVAGWQPGRYCIYHSVTLSLLRPVIATFREKHIGSHQLAKTLSIRARMQEDIMITPAFTQAHDTDIDTSENHRKSKNVQGME